jgi:predicted enzyme related to lactoylglutathione lyase
LTQIERQSVKQVYVKNNFDKLNLTTMKKIILTTLILLFTFGLGYFVKTITIKPDKLTINQNLKNTKMKKVTGIGGIFFKCKDPQKVKEWYKTHLGLNTDQYGAGFEWRESDDATKKGLTQWTPFSDSTTYFDPSVKDFMINYRVENLEKLVEELRKEGVTIVDTMETYDYGKFIHILDLDGNKIELWEPMGD